MQAPSEVRRWPGPLDYGWAVAVSKSGRYLAALGRYKGLFVYDTKTGKRVRADKLKESTMAGPPAFVRDDLLVAPPYAISLSAKAIVAIPPYPPGNIFSAAVAARKPVIAFSHREGLLIGGRLREKPRS